MNPKNVIRNMLDEYKDIALSDEQVMELVNGDANVILVKNLRGFDSIEELLGENDACFLLYESKEHFGHWCALVKTKDKPKDKKSLEFFDPYGGSPDSQLNFITEPFLTESGQNKMLLSKLLLKYDGDLSYNEFQFQTFDKGVKDCGRWCALRIMLKELSLEMFKDLFFNIYSDDLATFLTMDESQLEVK